MKCCKTEQCTEQPTLVKWSCSLDLKLLLAEPTEKLPLLLLALSRVDESRVDGPGTIISPNGCPNGFTLTFRAFAGLLCRLPLPSLGAIASALLLLFDTAAAAAAAAAAASCWAVAVPVAAAVAAAATAAALGAAAEGCGESTSGGGVFTSELQLQAQVTARYIS
jgi:hypothetical protein